MPIEIQSDNSLFTDSVVTKEEFISYEQVRQSGVTNMFNVNLVCEITELTKKQVLYIMNNYTKLDKGWPDVRATNWEADGKKIGIVNLHKQV